LIERLFCARGRVKIGPRQENRLGRIPCLTIPSTKTQPILASEILSDGEIVNVTNMTD
jgi:hypothetical protein